MSCCKPKNHQLIKYGCKLFQLNSRLALSTFSEPTIDNCGRERGREREMVNRAAPVSNGAQESLRSCLCPAPSVRHLPAKSHHHSVGLQLSRRHVLSNKPVPRQRPSLSITTVSCIFHLYFIGDCHSHSAAMRVSITDPADSFQLNYVDLLCVIACGFGSVCVCKCLCVCKRRWVLSASSHLAQCHFCLYYVNWDRQLISKRRVVAPCWLPDWLIRNNWINPARSWGTLPVACVILLVW